VYEKKDKNRERKEIRRVVACNDVSFSESIIKEGREYVGTVGYIKQMRIPIDKEADGTDITVTEEDFEKNGSVRKPFIKTGDGISNDIQKIGLISDMKITAEEMLKYKRSHWKIENNLHHVLDDAFREDRSTATHSKYNLSLIRKIAYNILQLAINREKKRVWNNSDDGLFCRQE